MLLFFKKTANIIAKKLQNRPKFSHQEIFFCLTFATQFVEVVHGPGRGGGLIFLANLGTAELTGHGDEDETE
jgi:hypothetical protein